MKPEISVVWLKRDLRWRDHAAFDAALKHPYPIVALYCFEPELMSAPMHSDRHWTFVQESLNDLERFLEQWNVPLLSGIGEVEEGFDLLREAYTIKTVFSHEEIGIGLTFERDKRMLTYFKEKGINWKEFQHNAVIRGLKNRYRWNELWHEYMHSALIHPDFNQVSKAQQGITKPERWFRETAFSSPRKKSRQAGGVRKAWKYLESFFELRGKGYSGGISKPERSRSTCSRLSPYLAWGNLSLREVYHEALKHKAKPGWQRSMQNFISRLHWHCHFIQKFEMECSVESSLFNRGYEQLPFNENQVAFERWKNGTTGIPLVDACMRCLTETGYLNFRMRAMLISFHSHHLFLRWKQGADHLASLFLDFEPGIHFPQIQMQAGLVGVHTLRIYNPTKQAQDHDPQAEFIQKWVPELRGLPADIAIEPWKLSPMERMMFDYPQLEHYPEPIVNLDHSAKKARDLIWNFRQDPTVIRENARILVTHTLPGSRNR
ncbi:MAG: deoxyribodipyrimidine photo-lyase [Flavobacteriales bacterium]|nr:deoxyribodipyrimidine photo-lyase [Flavobacteriales bacterium]